MLKYRSQCRDDPVGRTKFLPDVRFLEETSIGEDAKRVFWKFLLYCGYDFSERTRKRRFTGAGKGN
jgi:hypothetical protein